MGLLLGILLYPAIIETRRQRFIVYGLRALAIPMVLLAFVFAIKNFCTLISCFLFDLSPGLI